MRLDRAAHAAHGQCFAWICHFAITVPSAVFVRMIAVDSAKVLRNLPTSMAVCVYSGERSKLSSHHGPNVWNTGKKIYENCSRPAFGTIVVIWVPLRARLRLYMVKLYLSQETAFLYL